MHLNARLFIIIVIKMIVTVDSKFCYWSKATAAIVKPCPKTRLDVEKRAKLKNCQALALTQNCTTEPRKFKYHCVMNEYENAFVEVCATEYYIHEYNTYGAVIQPHYRLKCSDVDPPCSERYISTDAYLYEGCYDIVEKNMHRIFTELQLNTTVSISNNDSTVSETESGDRRYHILIGCLLVAATVVGVLILTRACANNVENNSHENKENASFEERTLLQKTALIPVSQKGSNLTVTTLRNSGKRS